MSESYDVTTPEKLTEFLETHTGIDNFQLGQMIKAIIGTPKETGQELAWYRLGIQLEKTGEAKP